MALPILTFLQEIVAAILAQLAKAGVQIGKQAAADAYAIIKRCGDILSDVIAGNLSVADATDLGQQQMTLLGIILHSAISDAEVAAEQVPSDISNALSGIFLNALKLI